MHSEHFLNWAADVQYHLRSGFKPRMSQLLDAYYAGLSAERAAEQIMWSSVRW